MSTGVQNDLRHALIAVRLQSDATNDASSDRECDDEATATMLWQAANAAGTTANVGSVRYLVVKGDSRCSAKRRVVRCEGEQLRFVEQASRWGSATSSSSEDRQRALAWISGKYWPGVVERVHGTFVGIEDSFLLSAASFEMVRGRTANCEFKLLVDVRLSDECTVEANLTVDRVDVTGKDLFGEDALPKAIPIKNYAIVNTTLVENPIALTPLSACDALALRVAVARHVVLFTATNDVVDKAKRVAMTDLSQKWAKMHSSLARSSTPPRAPIPSVVDIAKPEVRRARRLSDPKYPPTPTTKASQSPTASLLRDEVSEDVLPVLAEPNHNTARRSISAAIDSGRTSPVVSRPADSNLVPQGAAPSSAPSSVANDPAFTTPEKSATGSKSAWLYNRQPPSSAGAGVASISALPLLQGHDAASPRTKGRKLPTMKSAKGSTSRSNSPSTEGNTAAATSEMTIKPAASVIKEVPKPVVAGGAGACSTVAGKRPVSPTPAYSPIKLDTSVASHQCAIARHPPIPSSKDTSPVGVKLCGPGSRQASRDRQLAVSLDSTPSERLAAPSKDNSPVKLVSPRRTLQLQEDVPQLGKCLSTFDFPHRHDQTASAHHHPPQVKSSSTAVSTQGTPVGKNTVPSTPPRLDNNGRPTDQPHFLPPPSSPPRAASSSGTSSRQKINNPIHQFAQQSRFPSNNVGISVDGPIMAYGPKSLKDACTGTSDNSCNQNDEDEPLHQVKQHVVEAVVKHDSPSRHVVPHARHQRDHHTFISPSHTQGSNQPLSVQPLSDQKPLHAQKDTIGAVASSAAIGSYHLHHPVTDINSILKQIEDDLSTSPGADSTSPRSFKDVPVPQAPPVHYSYAKAIALDFQQNRRNVHSEQQAFSSPPPVTKNIPRKKLTAVASSSDAGGAFDPEFYEAKTGKRLGAPRGIIGAHLLSPQQRDAPTGEGGRTKRSIRQPKNVDEVLDGSLEQEEPTAIRQKARVTSATSRYRGTTSSSNNNAAGAAAGVNVTAALMQPHHVANSKKVFAMDAFRVQSY